ncbi:MAG: superoxide dismutase family protein [Flavobacteriales bacterium]|nr:superoxide dismutase family protein [Flavobacteriales bacterium]PJB18273.1 MAG: superoxide dismutase [Flavobacteriaceae bacterium CG_4_9_14_3_um_filter_33_16]
MKKTSIFTLALLIVLTVGCKNEKKETEQKVEEPITEKVEQTSNVEVIKFSLEPKSDSNVSGTVTFTQENGSVTMVAEMEGLTEGIHAIHIHEKADCSSPDGKSTGGHWNPTAQPHGKWGAEEGYHKGDIGNFIADASGKGSITFTTDQWCIGCGDEAKDILGKAVIVHAGTDDYTTQPTGDAGGRVSCAGIIK